MFKKLVLVLFSLIAFVSYVDAKTVGGVEMEESMTVDDGALILNGVGIREKFFTNIYVAGLYLKQKSSDFQQIMDMDESMAIKIKITSKLITSQRFKEACEEGFQRTTNGNTAPFKAKIDLFYTAFTEAIGPGDFFDMVYVEGVGTRCSKNGKLLTTIEGSDFKKILFGIWIIDKPSHKNEELRRGMLGLLQ